MQVSNPASPIKPLTYGEVERGSMPMNNPNYTPPFEKDTLSEARAKVEALMRQLA